MLTAAMAAPKISFDTVAMISFSAMLCYQRTEDWITSPQNEIKNNGDESSGYGQIDYGDEDNSGFLHHQFGHFSFCLQRGAISIPFPYSWTVYDLDLPGASGA